MKITSICLLGLLSSALGMTEEFVEMNCGGLCAMVDANYGGEEIWRGKRGEFGAPVGVFP